MGTFNITSDDTLTLAGRVFQNYADGDVSTITFPNPTVDVKTGKNQNTLYSRNATGDNAQLVLRLIRGSPDDQFMQSKIAAAELDFVGQVLMNGEFVKRIGDGQSNVIRDVYTLLGGIITRKPDAKENVEGQTDQGVTIYNLTFANGKRSIQ